MTHTNSLQPLLLAGILSLATACRAEDPKSDGEDTDCSDPHAQAGDSAVFPLGTAITLDGSESSWCERYSDDEISFTWGFDRVPADSAVTESALSDNRNSAAKHPNFVPDTPGEYVLSLRVSDPKTASDPDYVVITISSDDLPPIADCGEDINGTVGQAARLDGSASTDPEGARLGFSWGVSSVPVCSTLTTANIYDQNTETPALVPDCQGMFVMSLVVDDGLAWSDPDYCTIDVRSDNLAPVAEAGTGGDLPPCTSNPFTLSGWESHDPDGDIITYAWSVVSAPAGADDAVYGFDDPTEVAPLFTWDVAGEWRFQLQVSDTLQTSSPDVVTFIIGPAGDNNSPTANAGGDQTVLVDANCSSSAYVWSCEDCPSTMVEIDGSGSSDPDGDTLQYSWTELTDTLEFTTTTTPVTHLTLPSAPAEYDVDNESDYTIQLDVNDCSMDDNDRITLTYICRGT